MQKTEHKKYSDFIRYAADNCCGKVYPFSVSQCFQYGDIFVENADGSEAVLFWHYCGFAYISGKISEAFLEDVYKIMLNPNNTRRFILMIDADGTERFFRSKSEVFIERRYLFEYTEKRPPKIPVLPSGFEIKEINAELLSEIHGGIVPSLFWDSSEIFSKMGKASVFGTGAILQHGRFRRR